MNYKNLLIIVAVLVILNIGFLYFQNTNNTKTFYSQPVNNTKTFSLPLDPNHKGTSLFLIYTFTGKVTKVQPVGENVQLTLDISDSKLPIFLVKKDRYIFIAEGKNVRQVPINSINVGQKVTISMSYDLQKKIWNVSAISVNPITP